MESKLVEALEEPQSKRFYIKEFNNENLLKELNYGYYPVEKLKKHYIYKYLCEFFNYSKNGHVAKSMVIERKYLSESYLNDFKEYYAESFNSYHKFTKRIHFFTETIDSLEDFRSIIHNSDSESMKNQKDFISKHYLGYSVIKPITNAFIGATFVKPYNDLGGLRKYNSLRSLKINLFGRNIKIVGCAFQQQDHAVSACATSALWTIMFISNKIFRSLSLSPAAITISAGLSEGKRLFPSTSLNTEQISKALETTGLVPEIRIKDKKNPILMNPELKRIIYAYNSVGIPILFGYKISDGKNKGENHIVAVVGYRLDGNFKNNYDDPDKLNLKADQVIRFYAHNDQVGPYAKIILDGDEYQILTCNIGNEISIKAKTKSIIIPLHDSIRVKFEDIKESISELNDILVISTFWHHEINKIESEFCIEWDIRLEYSNKYKERILNNSNIDRDVRIKVSESSYPKFIWLCTATLYLNDEQFELMDILYDPTDVPTGFCCLQANYFNLERAADFLSTLDDIIESLENQEIKDLNIVNLNHCKFFRAAFSHDEEIYLDEMRQFVSNNGLKIV